MFDFNGEFSPDTIKVDCRGVENFGSYISKVAVDISLCLICTSLKVEHLRTQRFTRTEKTSVGQVVDQCLTNYSSTSVGDQYLAEDVWTCLSVPTRKLSVGNYSCQEDTLNASCRNAIILRLSSKNSVQLLFCLDKLIYSAID